MSSTSRGGKRSAADFYETRPWVVHRLLERLQLPGGKWLESSAGEGGIIKAVNEVRKDVEWHACELREECRVPLIAAGVKSQNLSTGISFLDIRPADVMQYDVCINNVPFSLTQQFIEHTLQFARWVIHLQKLNYIGSEQRNAFFKKHMPDVRVIPDRVSFALSVSCVRKKICDYAEIFRLEDIPPKKCPKCEAPTKVSSSDSIEYAWLCFPPERNRRQGIIEVLDHTPVEWRKVQPKVKAA